MRYGVLHGAAFHMATAFADPHAVIPLFVAGFTESRAMVGLVISLVQAVGIVPRLGMSRQLRRNPRSARAFMLKDPKHVGARYSCHQHDLPARGSVSKYAILA